MSKPDPKGDPSPEADPESSGQQADGFTTGLGPEVETVVQNSKFFGQTFPLEDCEPNAVLDEVRARHGSANHHVYAWKTGFPPSVVEGVSDAGEPSGTAGAPCQLALHASGLTDAMVVVTRFFGGVKLGRGGLIRSYGESARLALAAAPRIPYYRMAVLRVETDYEDLGQIETCLARFSNQVVSVDRSFEAVPVFSVTLYHGEAQRFEESVNEATGRRALVTHES